METGEKPKRLNKTRQLEIIDERLGRAETTNQEAIQFLKQAHKLTSRKSTQKPVKAKPGKLAEPTKPTQLSESERDDLLLQLEKEREKNRQAERGLERAKILHIPRNYADQTESERELIQKMARQIDEQGKKNGQTKGELPADPQMKTELPGVVTAEDKILSAAIETVRQKHGANAIPIPDIIDYR